MSRIAEKMRHRPLPPVKDEDRFNSEQRRRRIRASQLSKEAVPPIRAAREIQPEGLLSEEAIHEIAEAIGTSRIAVQEIHYAHLFDTRPHHCITYPMRSAGEEQVRRFTQEAYDRLEAKGLIRKTSEIRNGEAVYEPERLSTQQPRRRMRGVRRRAIE